MFCCFSVGNLWGLFSCMLTGFCGFILLCLTDTGRHELSGV